VLEQDHFISDCSKVKNELCSIYLHTRLTGYAPLRTLESLAKRILYPLLSVPESFLLLHRTDGSENYLYRHSIDVALLSGFITRWLGYGESDVREMVYTGLVHDIGKARVCYSVISKPGALDGDEKTLAQVHVEKSIAMLSATRRVSKQLLDTVRQHHEKMDGTGYPDGLQGKEICPFARVLAVADVYDALTSNRYYKKAVSPFAAAGIMLQEMKGHFDPNVLEKFFEHACRLLMGRKVRLDDGTIGQLVFFYPYPAFKPIVTCPDGGILDLSKQQDIPIVELVMNP
jgi:putative nucleotidyltransferase with HDIG domain